MKILTGIMIALVAGNAIAQSESFDRLDALAGIGISAKMMVQGHQATSADKFCTLLEVEDIDGLLITIENEINADPNLKSDVPVLLKLLRNARDLTDGLQSCKLYRIVSRKLP